MNGMFEIFKQRFFQTLPALKIGLAFTPSVILSQFGEVGGRLSLGPIPHLVFWSEVGLNRFNFFKMIVSFKKWLRK